MRNTSRRIRISSLAVRGLCLGVFLGLMGCVNLPETLERELRCPPTDVPDHYGNERPCR